MSETINLTLERCAWSEQAGRVLERSTRMAPCTTARDYRDLLAIDPSAHLYHGTVDGKIVGYVLLRTEHFSMGSEGVIVAVAGRLPGMDLIDAFLPAIEREFKGVAAYRFTSARRGLLRKMKSLGYYATHVTMRKPAQP